MKRFWILNLIAGLFSSLSATAQFDELGGRVPVGLDNQGRPYRTDTTGQRLERRNPNEDSISIYYKYFDSSSLRSFDSSINDFYTRYPLPWTFIDLGNFGNAARNLVFSPTLKPGFDAGLNAYNIYQFTYQNTKFFQSTRPYTETVYLLGSRGEQMIELLHTQNRNANFNFTFNYRIINSQGTYKNQNTNHSNLRIATSYQSTRKRYQNQFIFINNRLRSSENGGVQDPKKLDSLSLNDPFEAETRMGTTALTARAIFSSEIGTGTTYFDSRFLFRQNYDIGQLDSMVTDTSVSYLFYPRLRLQHTVMYDTYKYKFQDQAPDDSLYVRFYNFKPLSDTILFEDKWQVLNNQFSLISFPEKNNLNQFVKLGAALEYIRGSFRVSDTTISNFILSGEYRNKTRNKLWDVQANATIYLIGPYVGNYQAYASLQKNLKNNKGSLVVGALNVNSTPSFLTKNAISSFPVLSNSNFKDENTLKLFTRLYIQPLSLLVEGNYYIATNYTYFRNSFEAAQESTLFNLIQLRGEKKITLSRNFNWYSELVVQQASANPPVNLPLALTRNRVALEGVFFTNLNLSTGLEMRYYLPYRGDNFNPINGQFFFQDSTRLANRPDINLFLHFRIKSFKGFIRAEGLNTVNFEDGFNFTKFNFHAPNYGSRGFWFRMGIWWSFVN